ncbi:hypothetical protein AgCh_018512 [Apium graveolens]
MDKGKKRASSSTSKSIWRQRSIAECIGRGKKKKEDESARNKKKCVNQNILGEIKAEKEKLQKAYNDRSLPEDERICQIDEVYKKYDKMEINLIEREDSEIAWYVEGHQAWRDVGEGADEVVESAGTDDDQYVDYMAGRQLINPGPIDGGLLTQQNRHHSQLVWGGTGNDDHLRLRSNFKTYWDCVLANPLPQPIQDAITEACFMGVLQDGSMRHDAGLISAFLDRWRPKTHTFHLRFGEATVTLEDVYYILGLRDVGRPVLPIPGDVDALLVHELLGVAPDPQQDTDVIKKGEIKISWLVRQFGDCSRLHSAAGHDHECELLYHTRAHLLLLIGSTVPNYNGYHMPLNLLPFVRHLALDKTELYGSMTLLQVWIYEHCTALAPRQRDPYLMQHPRALRWMVPLDDTDSELAAADLLKSGSSVRFTQTNTLFHRFTIFVMSSALSLRSILDAHKLTGPNLAVCFHCNKLGHWKRNYKVYLAELKKKRSKTTASDSCMFMIEVNMSLGQISTWVLDIACGSHILQFVARTKGK